MLFRATKGSSHGHRHDELKDVLYSAVLSDILDDFGLMDQAMRPFVRPLDEQVPLFGRARTGNYMNTFSVPRGRQSL